ncbi:hypothetical protein D8674_017894 [Pyrus ussuriensis x Pyrus communis]|uniref:Reverse transcriptase n=1 Tax=Pyrus ussuriensis x Pyrus communis TaxID=2448454 RepID=A0A5N5HS81_9ROSA|nr:hypothetical protein D8674_017894 [Pyrus ussuriensis x Pyrus communis]
MAMRRGAIFNGSFCTDGGVLDDENFNAVKPRVPDNFRQGLILPFTREEIEASVKNIGPTKSLGLDGMTALFYQKYWNVVRDYVCDACLYVLNGNGDVSTMNKTLITSTPKINLP